MYWSLLWSSVWFVGKVFLPYQQSKHNSAKKNDKKLQLEFVSTNCRISKLNTRSKQTSQPSTNSSNFMCDILAIKIPSVVFFFVEWESIDYCGFFLVFKYILCIYIFLCIRIEVLVDDCCVYLDGNVFILCDVWSIWVPSLEYFYDVYFFGQLFVYLGLYIYIYIYYIFIS